MMIGNYLDPTVHAPPWIFPDDLTVDICSSPNAEEHYSTYLPSNDALVVSDSESFTCENFRMFEFKVKKCMRGGSHDWTECPFAHPGEKARRRDPRKYHYSGTACADFRKGGCVKGDLCEFAHGVFECWLHPARYRTQPCKDGIDCRRKVCFFAHTRDQLRVLSPTSPIRTDSYDGSPLRLALESVSSSYESPPLSPISNSLSRPMSLNSVNEMVASLRQLQLNKIKPCPSSWGVHSGLNLGSPRLSVARARPVFSSLPSTPSGIIRAIDMWDNSGYDESEHHESGPVMERVESGRDLRAKLFEKLSRENPLDKVDVVTYPVSDVGWDSKLFQ